MTRRAKNAEECGDAPGGVASGVDDGRRVESRALASVCRARLGSGLSVLSTPLQIDGSVGEE